MPDSSDRIREAREALGLSQQALAEKCGVTARSQRNYESGERNPDAAYLAAFASAGADVLYVITGQRSQAAAEVDLLPSDERVLVDAYRRCNAEAKRNLIQTAALLSAGMGMPSTAATPPKRAAKAHAPAPSQHATSGGINQINHGHGAVQIGAYGGKVNIKKGG